MCGAKGFAAQRTRMAIELCVLGSGSAGNCSVLRAPSGVMLIDAGLGPRVMASRMNGTGIALADVSAICLTHLDRDHFSFNWIGTIARRGIRVFCHADRVADLHESAARAGADSSTADAFARCIVGFDAEPFEPLVGVRFSPVHLAHDHEGSHGFIAEGFDRRVGYATDLGRVPAHLLDLLCGVNVLAIESNYDPLMQMNSPRPSFLKQRITGGRGHLSNQQAFDAVKQVMDRCEKRGMALPEHVVLLHRSRECNCPKLLRTLFERDTRIRPRLTLSDQFARTEWLRSRGGRPLAGEQLQLMWG
jgi:phosphoribosyl 1,2-cyclic phosphodiesterase